MTKCLALGMDLPSVVRASTIKPAQSIGWGDKIGTLDVGEGHLAPTSQAYYSIQCCSVGSENL